MVLRSSLTKILLKKLVILVFLMGARMTALWRLGNLSNSSTSESISHFNQFLSCHSVMATKVLQMNLDMGSAALQ